MLTLNAIQNLDIISVNLWQILISLANLVLLFFIIKFFLYKPVKNVLAKRRAELEKQYEEASQAQKTADENKKEWSDKLASASAQADAIMQNATENAKIRGDKIIADAEERAEGIIRRAESEAELELKKASDDIKRQIVEVSGALTEKMLEREINEDDHRALIDAFIEEMGEDNE